MSQHDEPAIPPPATPVTATPVAPGVVDPLASSTIDVGASNGGATSGSGPGAQQSKVEQGKQAAGTAAEQGREVAGTAAEQGKQVAQAAAEGARDVVQEAKGQASEVARTASDQAMRMVSDARTEARNQATAQTERLAEGLRAIGGQLQGVAAGEPLDEGTLRDLAEEAGTRMAAVADRLADGGIDGMVQDVTTFARRRPVLFLAGAAATGFLAGRLLRGMQADGQSSGGSSPATGGGAASPPLRTDGAPVQAATADTTGVIIVDEGAPVDVAQPFPTGQSGLR